MTFENQSEKPSANPKGGNLGCDDIKLRWQGRPAEPSGKVAEVFEIVKARPFETIGLSIFVWFTSLIFVILIETILTLIPILLFDVYLEDTVSQTTAYPLYESFTQFFSSIFSIASELMVWATLSIVWLRIFRKQPLQASHLVQIVPFIPRVIGCAFIVSTLAHVGLIFVVVPGVIFWLGFSLAPFLIVDKNLGVWEAIKGSWVITKGHKTDLFVLNFYIFLLNIVGALCCGLGLLVTMPMSYGIIARFYDDLVIAGNAYEPHELNEDIFS